MDIIFTTNITEEHSTRARLWRNQNPKACPSDRQLNSLLGLAIQDHFGPRLASYKDGIIRLKDNQVATLLKNKDCDDLVKAHNLNNQQVVDSLLPVNIIGVFQ